MVDENGEEIYTDTPSSSPTATANTGKNDSSSIWGSGLISGITSLGTAGIGAYGALTKPAATPAPGKAPTPAPATQAVAASPITKYLPYILGGVALLVVVGLFMRRK